MKPTVGKIGGRAIRGRRKSVAQILRAAYERFSRDKDTLMAVKAILGHGAKP
jgi:hypothetical protein